MSGELVPSDGHDDALRPEIVDEGETQGTAPAQSMRAAIEIGVMMGAYGTMARMGQEERDAREQERRAQAAAREKEATEQEQRFKALRQRIEELCAMPEGAVDDLIARRIAESMFHSAADTVRVLRAYAADAGIELPPFADQPMQVVITAIDAQRNGTQFVLTPDAMYLQQSVRRSRETPERNS